MRKVRGLQYLISGSLGSRHDYLSFRYILGHPSQVKATPLTKEYLPKEYKDVFTGIGLFPRQPYHTEADESIPPVQHPPRQVAVHPQPAYKKELERLTDLGIITEVQNEFTPWVNSVVVTRQMVQYAYASIHGI